MQNLGHAGECLAPGRRALDILQFFFQMGRKIRIVILPIAADSLL